MKEPEPRPKVKVGDVVQVGFAWGGAVGKTLGSFAVELLEDQGNQFLTRVVEFRGCRYYWHDENFQRFDSPYMTTREELPPALAAEIALLVGSLIPVADWVAQSGTSQYILRPDQEPEYRLSVPRKHPTPHTENPTAGLDAGQTQASTEEKGPAAHPENSTPSPEWAISFPPDFPPDINRDGEQPT